MIPHNQSRLPQIKNSTILKIALAQFKMKKKISLLSKTTEIKSKNLSIMAPHFFKTNLNFMQPIILNHFLNKLILLTFLQTNSINFIQKTQAKKKN
jgi:hypothetical protein